MTAAPATPQAAYSLYHHLPKQAYAFDLIFRERVEQILYGGARGGAKSHWARSLAAYLANLWPGSKVGIFRRTDAELQSNHINKWMTEVDPYIPGGRFFIQAKEYHWPSPAWCWCEKGKPCVHSSITSFEHVDDNRGAQKYQGFQFAAMIIDEATHFKGPAIEFLYTSVRADENQRNPSTVTGPDGKKYEYPGWPGYLQLQALTANPGDIGHAYCYANYIDPEEGLAIESLSMGETDWSPKEIVDGPYPLGNPHMPGNPSRWRERITLADGEERIVNVDMTGGQIWSVEVDPGGGRKKVRIRRAFVPSRLEDNPYLNSDEYIASLSVGSRENLQRMLNGDWSYSEDRVFKVLDRAMHLVDGKRIFGEDEGGETGAPPHDWPRAIGLDHGSVKPTAAEWICYDDEGFLVVYAEYYEPGSVRHHVESIRRIMEWDGRIDIIPQADPQMWRKNQNVGKSVISVAALYALGGDVPAEGDGDAVRSARERGIQLAQSKITDDAALASMQELFEPSPDRMFPTWHPRAGEYGSPLMFITEDCPNLWRELTNLRRPAMEADGTYAEGIKNGQPDHAFDGCKRAADPLRRAVVLTRRRGHRYSTPTRTFGYASA